MATTVLEITDPTEASTIQICLDRKEQKNEAEKLYEEQRDKAIPIVRNLVLKMWRTAKESITGKINLKLPNGSLVPFTVSDNKGKRTTTPKQSPQPQNKSDANQPTYSQ